MEEITKDSDYYIDFVKQNPEYFYFIILAVSLLFLMGCLKKWDWIVNKDRNYYERKTGIWVAVFGEKIVRLFIAVVASLGIIISSVLILNFYN